MTSAPSVLPVLPESIPEELKGYTCWITWKAEPRRLKDGSPKITKVPYFPDGSRMASSSNPETWGDFQTALNTYKSGKASGIGYVFAKKNGIVGVDLDHAVKDGAIHPKALEIIERLGSYTEYSVSGTGLHILLRGSVPWNGRRKEPVEIYGHCQFFTMTGHVLNGYPEIRENQGVLDLLVSSLWPSSQESLPSSRPDRSAPRRGEYIPPADDGKLIELAGKAKNGKKFTALMSGDWQGQGYKSQSEADAALVSLLMYWTGNDRPRSEELFRSSGLFRPKFDLRPEYREGCFRLCGGGGAR